MHAINKIYMVATFEFDPASRARFTVAVMVIRVASAANAHVALHACGEWRIDVVRIGAGMVRIDACWRCDARDLVTTGLRSIFEVVHSAEIIRVP